MLNSVSLASVNRAADWKAICQDIFGWSESLPPSTNNTNTNSTAPIVFVDLTGKQHAQKETLNAAERKNDHLTEFWSTAIQQVEENMNRMIRWLEEKRWTYISPKTLDEEASLIQSTVSSYTVTTANELDNLRRHYQNIIQQQQQLQQHRATKNHIHDSTSTAANIPSRSPQQQQHDMAMIQILSERLKERVAEPFHQLQKRRQRRAVQLWQEPLHCRYVPILKRLDGDDDEENVEDDEMDKVLGLTSPRREEKSSVQKDRRFQPTRPRISLGHEQHFLEAYKNQPSSSTSSSPEMPHTVFAQHMMPTSKRPRPSSSVQDDSSVSSKPLTPIKNLNEQRIKRTRIQAAAEKQPKQQHAVDDETSGLAMGMIDAEELQQESVLLQARRQQHDLDAVQSMETTMVQITALLSQFSELVSNQQEEVWQIHDAVKDSKDNVEKGQDQLIDAKERAENSKHYMASAIFGMGVAMLFFHWVRP